MEFTVERHSDVYKMQNTIAGGRYSYSEIQHKKYLDYNFRALLVIYLRGKSNYT